MHARCLRVELASEPSRAAEMSPSQTVFKSKHFKYEHLKLTAIHFQHQQEDLREDREQLSQQLNRVQLIVSGISSIHSKLVTGFIH